MDFTKFRTIIHNYRKNKISMAKQLEGAYLKNRHSAKICRAVHPLLPFAPSKLYMPWVGFAFYLLALLKK